MEFFKQHKTYDFMGMRRFWIALSVLLTVGSTFLLFYPGPNYGTDFRGGTEIEVAFKKHTDGGHIREAVVGSGQFSEPDVVQVQGHESQFLIRVQEISTVNDLTKDQVKAKIEAAGYTNVSDIRREEDHFDAKATKDGKKVALDVDAKTGAVTPEDEENEEHEHQGKDKDND